MARLFNVRQGFTSDDDDLPKSYFQPRTGGQLKLSGLDPDKMHAAKRHYYALMGWNRDGIPSPEKWPSSVFRSHK